MTVIRLSDRERRLLWEAVTMVDPDTLRDNLERVGAVEEGENLPDVLDQIADILDPGSVYVTEWQTAR